MTAGENDKKDTETTFLTQPDDHGPTMAALLKQYTSRATLTEVDEDGEHPLFPIRRDGPGEVRVQRSWQGNTGTGDAERHGLARKTHIIWHFDSDRYADVKGAFEEKGGERGLTSAEFRDVMRGFYVGSERDDAAAQLEALHARLAGNDPEATVVWQQFAACLVSEGVVSSTVSGFNIVQVLSHIEDKEKITSLKDEFYELGNALNLEQFVVIMKQQFRSLFEITSLFELHEQDRQLVSQIVNLFELIDINGKNSMNWEDFLAFLADQGMTEDVAREFNIIRFDPSTCRDDTEQKSHIEAAYYLERFDKIAFIVQGKKELRLCTPDFVPFGKPLQFQQPPLCVEYIDKHKYLVVSSYLSLSFFDAENNLKLVRRFETRHAQLVMCWSEVGQVLFSADHEGRIFAWDLLAVKVGSGRSYQPHQEEWKEFRKDRIMDRDPPMRHFEPDEGRPDIVALPTGGAAGASLRKARNKGAVKATDPSHPNCGGTIVTMLLELPPLAQMASCGVDRNVMIWDVHTGTLKQTLRGHEMGVRCMAFATSTKSLVTGGFDYNLFVWNPYVHTSIHTMQGHAAPIVGIAVIGSTSGQVVSADSEGCLKTWDLGTYAILQSIIVEEILSSASGSLRAFVSIPQHKRIVAADRKFHSYDYRSTGVSDQTDEAPIIKAFYHQRLKVFITGCTTHVRIWDGVTGGIKCVITHDEITDFCLDDRGRKVFIADHSGRIFVHNSTTGVEIKCLTKHQKEVSRVIYCQGDHNVLSVSWDRSLVIHDDASRTPKKWRDVTNVHRDDITCVAYSRHLGLVATGSTDCVISVRDYQRLRLITSLLGHKTDVTALAFVEPFHLLVSADFAGYVACWRIPEPGKKHKYDSMVLTRFINMQSLESSALVNCLHPVYETTQEDDKDNPNGRFTLYTGDEDGDVRVWDLSRLLVEAEFKPSEPRSDWEPHKKGGEMDATHVAEEMAILAAKDKIPELPIPPDMNPVVRRVRWWKAHTDSIRSLEVYSTPDCVVTAGYDHMVKVWTRTGELMCVLGQPNWNFPASDSMAGIDDAQLDRVLSRVASLERAMKVLSKSRATKTLYSLEDEVQQHKVRVSHA